MASARVRFCAAVRSSGCPRDGVKGQRVRPRAGRYRVGVTLIVAELHEQGLVVKLLDPANHGATAKP